MNTLDAGRIDLWWIDLARTSVRFSEAGTRLLSAAELARAGRFKFGQEARRFIAAHCALRLILADYANERPERLEFDVQYGGKPVLTTTRGIAFNMSHSEDWGIVAITAQGQIGVDVERIRPVPEARALAQRYFTRSERLELQSSHEAERNMRFLRCWTRKEAIIKARGAVIDRSIQSIEAGFSGLRSVGEHWLTSVTRPEPGAAGLRGEADHCAALALNRPIESIRARDFS